MKIWKYLSGLIFLLMFMNSCDMELQTIPFENNFTSLEYFPGDAGVSANFNWDLEYDDLDIKFSFYFGLSPDNLELDNAEYWSARDYYIDNLHYSTDYYWQVIALVPEGESFVSDISHFRTRDPEWNEFYPPDGEDELPLDIVFQWGTREFDSGPLYYRISAGTDSVSLDIIAEDLTGNSLEYDSLFYDTTYYWSLSLYDENQVIYSTKIMKFTTKSPVWQLEYPLDDEEEVDMEIEFHWNVSEFGESNLIGRNRDSEDDYRYELLLGTSEESLTSIATDLDTTAYFFDDFEFHQDYFWQVKALFREEQQLFSPILSFSTRDRLTQHYPSDGERHLPVYLELSWFDPESGIYDVYFGSEQGNLNLIAEGISYTSLPISTLDYSTEYFWRVDLHIDNDEIWEGQVMSFVTTIDPVSPGYIIQENILRAEQPCNIDIVYKVVDMAGIPQTDFLKDDFRFLEDNEIIDEQESLLEITVGEDINSTSRIVLMIDNSNSMESILDQIKVAALSLLANLDDDQEIAVFEFSESEILLQDFTNNSSLIENAINSIAPGYSSTDLYGSFINCIQHWENSYYPENITEGALIIITDGSDTQGAYTLEQAIEERGDKRVYTIGVGEEADTEALQQLANQNFWYLLNTLTLSDVLQDIQSIENSFAESFYWLHYLTPKRGNFDHAVEISIPGNPYTGDGSVFYETFNSSGFYGVLPGVYINVDSSVDSLHFGIDNYTISDSLLHIMTATSYYIEFEPQYQWSIGDSQIIRIQYQSSNADYIEISAGSQLGTTTLTVNDIANSYMKEIEVTSEVILRQ